MKTQSTWIALTLSLLGVAAAAAQPVPTAHQFAVKDVGQVDTVLGSPLDLVKIAAEDDEDARNGLPPRYAIAEKVEIDTADRGTWETLPDGRMLWRLRILGREGTTSLNLGFSRFAMTPGGQLLVYSTDGQQVLRPFTAADNEAHGELWTPVVITADLMVEVTVPAAEQGALQLELGSLNQGYRGFGTTPTIKSGSCNMDVECLDGGDPWRAQVRSVAVYSRGGGTLCTGSLINDTANDHKMYFITANHCGMTSGNAASIVAYWNYQNSFCRTPGSAQSGQAGDGSLAQFHTGSFFRASYSPSDVTLVELDDPPVPAFNHFWEGWDRATGDITCTGGAPCTAIHHPNTDEKRITYAVTTMVPSSWATIPPTPGDSTHIWVHWATDPPGPFTVPGVTEPGSSGSPLYNALGRFVGQLHGGASACGATGDNLSDVYGAFRVSWTGGGTSSTRVSDWLDAGNTNAMAIDGVNACVAPGVPAIGTATATAPNTIQVTWSNGAPPATTFNVYRAVGTCASPGPFSIVGPAVAGSPFNDGGVSGGTTYAYQVTGRDATGGCESAPSSCVQATATGSCTLPPTFAGLVSATNQAGSSCGVTLAWAAATANCGGPATYNVYRAISSGFVPGAGNLIAGGITGTGYSDGNMLANGVTYYYVVRAVDTANGVVDGNTVEKAVAPTGPIAGGTVTETFEGALSGGGFDNAGWTHNPIAGGVDWIWSTSQSQTPTHSWFSDSQITVSDRVLVSPSFVPQASSTLTFWHTYAFETNGSGACYDAGTLEVSTNGGGSWTVVPDAAFTAGLFNGTVNSGFSNPLAGKRAWCQGTVGAMTQVSVNLGGFVGSADTKLRWHEGDDSSAQATGWYVDSVTLANVGAASACTTSSVIFANGFEGGVLPGPWGGVLP
ncbi:MAG TPA: trypsin-like peptidase domain-containing protein [Thermoanaerobaculia bacterium]|nr:trypsin-like peptidase domain-containing protein [Thermoanaerobaculia bacterium]